MKLLLTSSGNTNQSIAQALRVLLGKPFSDASLVFIPTAANPEKNDKSWLEIDLNNFRKLGFAGFSVIDLAHGEKKHWLPILEEADVLVFGGGYEKYLLEWIHKTDLDNLLLEWLKSKVYVGISAGAMITAKTLSLNDSSKLYNENFDGENKVRGLGYVDFEIRPHLNSKFYPLVNLQNLEKLAVKVQHPFYAIDDNTAIQIVDGEITIISEGEWKKFN